MATTITSSTHGGCGCGCGPAHDACDDPAGLQRTRFFARQLVGPEDFTQDQRYFREKHRRHNRMLHGWGVVCGCEVSPAGDAANEPRPYTVCVAPGYVLGPYGDEILVDAPVTFDVRRVADDVRGGCPPPADPWCSPVKVDRGDATPFYLAIRYDECQARPVQTESGCGCGSECEYSRIVDGFTLGILDELPEVYVSELPENRNEFDDLGQQGTTSCAAYYRTIGRRCPPCPTSPWVILADLTVSNGTLSVDELKHRRFAVAFGKYGFYCQPAQVVGTPVLVEPPAAAGQ
jgi:hypothetical protein